MIIYLSGPMSGIAEHNYPSFREAARVLRLNGHRVFSPHEKEAVDHDRPKSWAYYVKQDLLLLLERCDTIVLLPGWERSKGATLELSVARALGYAVFRFVDGSLEAMS